MFYLRYLHLHFLYIVHRLHFAILMGEIMQMGTPISVTSLRTKQLNKGLGLWCANVHGVSMQKYISTYSIKFSRFEDLL